MTPVVNKAGVTEVKVDISGSLVTLGYTLDMAEVRDQSFHHDVPGDQHGGPQGPPIDIQLLGRIAHVRVEMSKYDKTVEQTLRARLKNEGAGNAGIMDTADIGTLMIQDAKTFRVVLSNANDPRNFPICLIREPIEVGAGTKFSTLILEFEAHRNQSTGVIWDTERS